MPFRHVDAGQRGITVNVEWWAAYLLLGTVTGFFAGLLGIGGGLIMVPVFLYLFGAQSFPASHTMHFALGTAMAVIVPTSIASLRTHYARGAVNRVIVNRMVPGILAGTFAGATMASQLSGQLLVMILVVTLFGVATRMLFDALPAPDRRIPGRAGLMMAGGLIGMASGLVAIGGGLLTVPFLVMCHVRLHHAIGTAAAIGFPVALAGTAGYVINGILQLPASPEYSLGYVYLPALAGVVMTSMLTAPLGAKLAHRSPVASLRKVFAVILYLSGIRLLAGLL